ncbi:proteasome chaperone 1 [Asimina triloba]
MGNQPPRYLTYNPSSYLNPPSSSFSPSFVLLYFFPCHPLANFLDQPAMDFDLGAPHSMGTTIVGVTYDGGVVLGADSRTSTGMYVANRASDKITQLTDNVYLCRSGSAADTQVVADYVRHFLHQHTIQLGQPATVKVAANLIRLLSYNNKNMLQAGLIVGGWDQYEGGKIYSVPLGGSIAEQPFTIGGSGSSYLYGFFDQAWKDGMSKDEAEKLVVKAVSLAIARDGASGGVVRTVIVSIIVLSFQFVPDHDTKS